MFPYVNAGLIKVKFFLRVDSVLSNVSRISLKVEWDFNKINKHPFLKILGFTHFTYLICVFRLWIDSLSLLQSCHFMFWCFLFDSGILLDWHVCSWEADFRSFVTFTALRCNVWVFILNRKWYVAKFMYVGFLYEGNHLPSWQVSMILLVGQCSWTHHTKSLMSLSHWCRVFHLLE